MTAMPPKLPALKFARRPTDLHKKALAAALEEGGGKVPADHTSRPGLSRQAAIMLWCGGFLRPRFTEESIHFEITNQGLGFAESKAINKINES